MIIAAGIGEGESVLTTPGRIRPLLMVRSAAALTTAFLVAALVIGLAIGLVTVSVLVMVIIPPFTAVRRSRFLLATGMIGRSPVTLADPAELFHRAALAVGTQLQHQRDRQEQAYSEHHPYKECAFDWVVVK